MIGTRCKRRVCMYHGGKLVLPQSKVFIWFNPNGKGLYQETKLGVLISEMRAQIGRIERRPI
jgi:hypothetical protein